MASLGITNADLARHLNVTRQAVNGMLRRSNPTLDTLYTIERALGVPRAWLSQRSDLLTVAEDAAQHTAPDWIGEARAK